MLTGRKREAGMRVGFIGLGRMGLPMCANLVRAGYEVTAGDLRPGRQDAVAACGARWGGTAAEVAITADVLITVLPGTREPHVVATPQPNPYQKAGTFGRPSDHVGTYVGEERDAGWRLVGDSVDDQDDELEHGNGDGDAGSPSVRGRTIFGP